MRRWPVLVTSLLGFVLPASALNAAVNIRVDLGSQTMRVTSGDGETYLWPVSTARKGFHTPRGTFGVQSLQRLHYSRKYDNAPMPHSIFFAGGYAIHGTFATRSLGRAASHGCVRLSPAHAAALFQMVAAEGARISITDGARDVPRETRWAETGRVRPYRRAARSAAAPLFEAPFAPTFDDWGTDPAGY